MSLYDYYFDMPWPAAVTAAAAPVFEAAGTAGVVAAGTSLVCGKPTSLAAGDLMLFAGCAVVNITFSLAGWSGPAVTHLPNPPGVSTTVLLRIADAADAAASNFTFIASGSTNAVGGIIRISGASSTLAASAQYREASAVPVDPPSSGAFTLGNYLAVTTASQTNDRTFTPPAGYDERLDANDASNRTIAIATKTLTAATSEDPGTWTSSGEQGGDAWTLIVGPS